MVSKEYGYKEKKWRPQKTPFEVKDNEIILKKLLNKISHETYIGLKVAKEIEVGSSMVFNSRNISYIIDE